MLSVPFRWRWPATKSGPVSFEGQVLEQHRCGKIAALPGRLATRLAPAMPITLALRSATTPGTSAPIFAVVVESNAALLELTPGCARA